ncbi:Rid family hydrolase [uncultured Maricaulis sp.]|uniref:Rid family hydrolase n=1 Tax=uncultured Maricaulis sp. TaxID=174710 RepID=UPI0026020123|nr:Rid family hydrolase [uncultured Maricaulis sp.]
MTLLALAALTTLLQATPASAVERPAVEAFIPPADREGAEHFRMSSAVRAGDRLYLSGVVGYIRLSEARTPDAYEAAIRDAFERAGTVLASAGCDWHDVVEVTSFHVDMREHQEIFRAVREEFITEQPWPAWSGIGVEQLWSDALFVEMRIVAHTADC